MTTAKPMKREQKRNFTRRRIVDAARLCFYSDGVAETSMEKVARTAGVGRATLYLHFASKDAILIELLVQSLRAVRRIFEDLCLCSTLDLPTLTAWLRSYAATLRSHPDAMQLVRNSIASSEEARRLITSHQRAMAEMLADRFPQASDGTLRGLARLLLLVSRIDYCVGAMAEIPPSIDPAEGADLVAREIVATIPSLLLPSTDAIQNAGKRP